MTGLGALRRSLPGRAAVPGGDVRRATARLQRVLAQVPEHVRRDVLGVDLDLVVAGRQVARRRDGRWRPDRTTAAVAGATAVAGLVAAGGAVAVLVGLVVAAVRALRGVRPRG